MLDRRLLLAGLPVGIMIGRASRAAPAPIRIGVLTDMSGVLSSVLGTGAVDGARMAIEDFGGKAAGLPVELVFADHQNKTDVASNIARKWIDEDGVDMVMDLGNSAAAIAVQGVVKEKNRICIVTSAASSDITGKFCNRNTFHWCYDTYMQSAAVASELTRQGGDTWFFISADYAYGHSLEEESRVQIEKFGGKVLGAVRHPANGTDFSSFLLQAQASRAKIIGLATTGTDLEHLVQQGAEFQLWEKQRAVAFGLQLYYVPTIGAQYLQGALNNSTFYWDRTDETRAFSRRFWARNGKPPGETHAANYSAVTQYLKAIAAVGSKDVDGVLNALHGLPVNDVVTPEGRVRADGRLVRPTYLVKVKKPADIKETWDCLDVVSTIPSDQAFRPVAESACPLLKA